MLTIASLSLAVAAAFRINKSQKHRETMKLVDTSEGLRFILQDSLSTPHQNSCITSKMGARITQIETRKLVSTQSLNSEEKEIKILISEMEQDSVEISDGSETEQRGVEMIDDYGEHSLENFEIKIVDENDDADVEQTAEQKTTQLESSFSSSTEDDDYSLMESTFLEEEEEEDDEDEAYSEEDGEIVADTSSEEDGEIVADTSSEGTWSEDGDGEIVADGDGEIVAETEEESSEGTWSSSSESDVEAISFAFTAPWV